MSLSGQARLAGVLGWPVSHSLSPALHGFWIQAHGLDAAYVPLPVAPAHFEAAVRALGHLGFRGANVTLPHKEQAFTLCDEADAAAQATGAVNTLVFDGERLVGRNTDVAGYLGSLDAAGVGDLAGAVVVVLGAGGAARGIVHGLLSRGVKQVIVANRTPARAEALALLLGPRVRPVAWEKLGGALASCDLLVNTTSLGMVGQAPLVVAIDGLRPTAVVSDIVYRPLVTPLLADAQARGHRTVDGLGMLLHQARPGFAAWFGVMPEVTPALRAHLVALLETRSPC